MTDLAPKSAWSDRVLALLAGLIVLCFYVITTCPTIYVGDSGDMTASAATLGIAHPTGYPLYVLLGKLFITLLPVGSVAYRANLFSGVTGAAAVVVGYFVLRRIGLVRPACFAGTLLVGFSHSFWGEATVARVYNLQVLITFIALYFLFTWMRQTRRPGLLWGFWLSVGLALANHTAIVSVLPAAVVAIVIRARRDNISPVRCIVTPLAVIPGLLLYLFIPIRAAMHPAINWMGEPTWGNLTDYFLRKQYWGRVYVTSVGRALEVFGHDLASLVTEFTLVGVGFIVVGLVVLTARRQLLLMGMLVSVFLVNVLALMSHGGVHDVFRYHRYLITGYSALAIVAAVGLDWFCRWEPDPSLPRSFRRGAGAWVVALLLAGFVAAFNFSRADRSRNYLAEDINRIILGSLPPGATLLPTGDEYTGPLVYLHEIERVRQDVKILPIGRQKKVVLPDPAENEIFYTQPWAIPWPTLTTRIEGLLYRVVPETNPPPPVIRWNDRPVRGLEDPRVKLDDHCRDFAAQYYRLRAANLERTDLDRAARDYLRSAEVAPDHASAQFNSADAFLRLGYIDAAVEYFARALRLDPGLTDKVKTGVTGKRPQEAPQLLERIATKVKGGVPPDAVRFVIPNGDES